MRQHTAESNASFKGLSFLWLELTNRCNLECVHCYTDSSPWSGDKDSLTKQHYLRALEEAAEAGCKQVQFIGGEPTLNADLPGLIKHASGIGYTFIEVYTNLVRLPDELIKIAKQTGTQFATSVYSGVGEVHDAVTGRQGSHSRTIANLKRLLSAGIPVRVGYIETESNKGHWNETASYLEDLGVTEVGFDVTRGFGRGAAVSDQCDAGELCGHCWDQRLCIAPDGQVSPCIMSKAWPVGNIKDTSVGQIAFAPQTVETRHLLYAGSRRDDSESGLEHEDAGGENCIPIPENCIPLPENCIPIPENCIPLPADGCRPDGAKKPGGENCIPIPKNCIPLPKAKKPGGVNCIPIPKNCIPLPKAKKPGGANCIPIPKKKPGSKKAVARKKSGASRSAARSRRKSKK